MARKGNNIYLRKDGRWEGRRSVGKENGKTVYRYVYAASYEEAQQKLADTAKKNALPMLSGTVGSPSITGFGDIAWEWLDFQKMRLKQSSISRYTNILNSYLLPVFGEQDITKIRRCDVKDFCFDLLRTGGKDSHGLSPATVSTVMSEIKNIFSYASREKDLAVADISGIPIRQNRNSLRVLTCTEQQKLEVFLLKQMNPTALGILLCLYTGMRIGEICALEWKDISEEEQTLSVHKTMQRVQILEEKRTEIIISTPKSRCSVRRIPLPDNLYRLLTIQRKTDDTYLLTGRADKYMEPRTLQYRFKTILKSCGIADANFHALRHTFATRCVELGFDARTLSEILGHATVNMTMNRYVHPTMEQKQRNMNLLTGLCAVR